MKLYLDDIRVPSCKDFIIVRSYNEAVDYVRENEIPEFISFDHDLGCDENLNILPSGYDFAKWLVEMDLDKKYIFPDGFSFNVHIANPIGRNNINSILNNYLHFRVIN